MPHVLEPASSGRASCRGCGRKIDKEEIRFGERIANPFAEGETTLWFHPLCAAYKRPEPVLEFLGETSEDVLERESLERAARGSSAHRRLPRIDGAEKAPSGRARCRCCREPIARGDWRIRLVFYEDGRFSPSGFVHLECRRTYFETDDILEPLLHFSPLLSDEERRDLTNTFERDPDAGSAE